MNLNRPRLDGIQTPGATLLMRAAVIQLIRSTLMCPLVGTVMSSYN